MWKESSRNTAFKKKLHRYRPDPKAAIETQYKKSRRRVEYWNSLSVERQVRQLLSDKVSGSMMGLWLLVPEHLRLGTWDLLCGWTAKSSREIEPRLALQLVHEAALCRTGVREGRHLSNTGFELTNGLPFIASDIAIHDLCEDRTVKSSQELQVALGRIRRATGHYSGKLLAIDPHRMRSYSKRRMRCRQKDSSSKPVKLAQTFFVLDADTKQPLCLTTATASRNVAQATPELLGLAAAILQPDPGDTLVLADTEHCSAELLDHVHTQTPFDLLVPMANQRSLRERLKAIPRERFTPRWAGYATLKQPHEMTNSQAGPYWQIVQRQGEKPDEWSFKSYLCTSDVHEADALTRDYPQRWHIEEFFNANQALGWKRGGTLNLNIRFAQMTMALVAQAALYQLRSRLGEPVSEWDAKHVARSLLEGLDGDIRVTHDTIVVTYYNASDVQTLRKHYENLPEKLERENIDPRIPWLYDFKLDFRFR